MYVVDIKQLLTPIIESLTCKTSKSGGTGEPVETSEPAETCESAENSQPAETGELAEVCEN